MQPARQTSEDQGTTQIRAKVIGSSNASEQAGMGRCAASRLGPGAFGYNARFLPSEAIMGFLASKKVLVTGMISNRSIAYGIAQAMSREGAQLAFTFQGDRIRDRVVTLAEEFGERPGLSL